MTECTECGSPVGFEKNTEVGEILSCSDCGTELEVTSINPPTVQKAPQEEEDWGE